MSLSMFRTMLSSPKIIKTRCLDSTAGFRMNMPPKKKKIYFYPEIESNIFSKIKLSNSTRIYNNIVVLVVMSTFIGN